jgi:hypothetical protein
LCEFFDALLEFTAGCTVAKYADNCDQGVVVFRLNVMQSSKNSIERKAREDKHCAYFVGVVLPVIFNSRQNIGEIAVETRQAHLASMALFRRIYSSKIEANEGTSFKISIDVATTASVIVVKSNRRRAGAMSLSEADS